MLFVLFFFVVICIRLKKISFQNREILDLVPCIDFNVYFVDRYMCIFIMIVDRYVYFH